MKINSGPAEYNNLIEMSFLYTYRHTGSFDRCDRFDRTIFVRGHPLVFNRGDRIYGSAHPLVYSTVEDVPCSL